MKSYFLRRLLLIPPTIIGITLFVFVVMRLAPGGPVEQGLARLMGGEAKRSRAEASFSLTASQVLKLEEDYDRDKPVFRAFAEWLGVLPRDLVKSGMEFKPGSRELKVPVPGTVYEMKVVLNQDGSGTLISPEPDNEALAKWQLRILSSEEQQKRWSKWVKGVELNKLPEPRAVIFLPGHDGLLQGSLGSSRKYQDPVWGMILERMPVSIYFGLISMVLTYAVCIPLGIVKAIKHRTWLDNTSSVMVFAGYAVPGYALGALLVVFLGAKLGWFPIRGFTGDDFDSLSLGGKVKDLFNHTFMPMLCYMIGSFALMTMMMKNSLMDNLASDYVRTAIAKGVSFPSAVFRHAFRNSLIPIATSFGNNVSLLVAGSMLIEKIFDINGFGLLQFSAILERDEPLVMGVLFISAMLMLIGNVLSDLCVALVDPRVSYK